MDAATHSSIMYTFQDMHTPVLNTIMLWITRIGTDGLIWLVLGLIFLITKRYRKAGFMMFFGSSINFVLVEVLKHIVKRPRPFMTLPGLHVIGLVPHSYSFPSGHASSAFVGAFIIAYYFRAWAIPAYALAVAIAFSRVYLLVHYPSDVIGGAIIGTISVILAFFFYRVILKRWFNGILRALGIEKK